MKKKSGPIHTMFPWDRVQGGFQESVCAREFVTILIIPEKITSSPQERNDCISGKDYNEFIVIGDVLDFILSKIFSNECGLLFWSCFWSVLRHSVQFAILGLPLFGERKNYHQLPTLFWLEMVHMMGLSTFMKKKVWESVGKHVFPPLFAFPFKA